MLIKNLVFTAWQLFNKFFDALIPVGDLFIRCWVAKAFIASGLTKIATWSSTLLLFQFEYQVKFLSPQVAAVTSVFIELGISSLLVLGLGGRLPALILFLFNIMAVASYPFLWTDQGYIGLKDHICWGIILLVILLHGTGKLSVDQLIKYFFYSKKR
ncbi:MAG TPA: DoxX family protein [Gammaproteobacteria bacterium]|jgi:putative oxidoreductase|nr:DoxX family protein [Gammaproteobacteria bacterium]